MEIRSILVSIGLGAQSTATAYAGQLAERFGAELIGVAAAEPSLVYAGIDNAQVALDYYDTERGTIEALLGEAEARFRSAVPASVKVSWRGLVANPTQTAIDQARRCDLVVAASGDVPSVGVPLDPGHLILASGRPVLLAGQGQTTAALDHIAIAWKDTREARRAVADAVPLLRQAKRVEVITRSEGAVDDERGYLADIVEWLGRHGIAAESRLLEKGAPFLDAAGLLAPATAPDLIVAGGYGHTRFREWLFGGVTSDLLETASISRLFSN